MLVALQEHLIRSHTESLFFTWISHNRFHLSVCPQYPLHQSKIYKCSYPAVKNGHLGYSAHLDIFTDCHGSSHGSKLFEWQLYISLCVDGKWRLADQWRAVKFGSRFVQPSSGEHSGARWFWLMIDVMRALMMLKASVWQTGVCYPDILCWVVRGKVGDLHRPERRQVHESEWLQEVKSRTNSIKSKLTDAGCRADCKWYRHCAKCDSGQLRWLNSELYSVHISAVNGVGKRKEEQEKES